MFNKLIKETKKVFVKNCLGCVPTEDEINEIISATEYGDSNGTIHLSRFLPHVSQLLAEHK